MEVAANFARRHNRGLLAASESDLTRLAGELKHVSALLEDARMVPRRVDRLVADACEEPVRRDLESLRDACEAIVARLGQRERAAAPRPRRRPPRALTKPRTS